MRIMKPMGAKRILIKVQGGLVEEVKGIPKGYRAYIHDYDQKAIGEKWIWRIK